MISSLKSFAAIAVVIAAVCISATAQGKSQSELASKTAKFETVTAADTSVKGALDAHDLKAAAGMVGKSGSFTGTVTKTFSPRSGTVLILNFDSDYKTALTAVIKRADYGKFPDLTKLEGKKVLITGKFTDFHDATQIELSSADQIKLIEK